MSDEIHRIEGGNYKNIYFTTCQPRNFRCLTMIFPKKFGSQNEERFTDKTPPTLQLCDNPNRCKARAD